MFPNVPVYSDAGKTAGSPSGSPGGFPQTPAHIFQVQLGINLAVLMRRTGVLLCAMLLLNMLACCIIVALSWKIRQDQSRFLKLVPVASRQSGPSFWNSEQRRLDLSGPQDSCEANRRIVTQQVWDYYMMPSRLQDFLLYMHCRKSNVLQAPGPACQEPDLFLLIAVKSLVPHFGQRQAIRQTWGRAGVLGNRTVATVFLLGQTPAEDHYPDLQGMLSREAELHGDLLQWEFRDTPLNLSLKEVLFLRWFHLNCSQTRFVLEAHDHTFVNTFKVLDFLETSAHASSRFLFSGNVISNGRPHRDQARLDFVPPSIFTGVYPPYAMSGEFLLSGEVALRLHQVTQNVLLFPVHEVYMGLCLRKLGLVPQKHPGFATLPVHQGHDDDEEKCGKDWYVCRKLLLVSGCTPQEMIRMWTTVGMRDCLATDAMQVQSENPEYSDPSLHSASNFAPSVHRGFFFN
ncbi:N-acetyllactosaminide beta-1,3-N-acetylglucosaminyltransferase 2a [Corythoichthys intestinalis]|uniref:N-acetyllactosaminide beta-1,3-N-acetylglucosaminyltransferase 2a n=1 Tax=Corythoichthys intestinalis TaxID=161448 RepID=UPI0025A656A2|nr:N-acetyllactosaminide beta-1,3-N-acetylglucosaminyltransferase 2a [Corythoichthys intestinalis]